MDKLKNFFDYIKVTMKDVLTKYVAQEFFKGKIAGFKGWIATVVLKKLNTEIINPLVDYLKRQVRKMINKKKASSKVEEIKNAQGTDELSDRFRDLP